VRALQMPLMAGLLRALPTWIAARVMPALGKTNWNSVSKEVLRDDVRVCWIDLLPTSST
jgi:hypothetical protein